MEAMTNEQFKAIIRMIIQILRDEKVDEKIIKKIEVLIEN